MQRRILLHVFCLAFLANTAVAKEKVFLMLVDGLRWDRLGYDFPSLDLLEEGGVRAEWTDPVFITVSSPSMMSIATGLYVESHGVLHNQAFDPETGEISSGYLDGLNNTWWFNGGGEPVWITAMRQGLKAGTFMYPGGQVPIGGRQPTRWQVSSNEERRRFGNLTDRVDAIFDWLYGPDDLDLVLFHLEVLDNALHAFGFTGLGLAQRTAAEVDDVIDYVLNTKMREEGVAGTLNLILTSDHGMVATPASDRIYLYDYIDESQVEFMFDGSGPLFQIKPIDGALESVLAKLNSSHPALHAFRKETFPQRFHYADNARNLPIIGYVDPPWTYRAKREIYVMAADHGYDNEERTMKSSFYATGPSFKKGYKAKHFESVNIYPLMCELLGIVPAPNNGSRDNYMDMLMMEESRTTCSPDDLSDCGANSGVAVRSNHHALHVIWAVICFLSIQYGGA